MGCFKPLIRIEDRTKWTTAADGHKYHPAKIHSSDHLESAIKWAPWEKKEIIPCGKCIGCRLDYSRQWANRGYLESLQWKDNYFVTLTYDDENIEIPEFIETSEGMVYTEIEEIPWTGTVSDKHLETFLNTLRKKFERMGHTGIRYMACGEYGEENRRPHYHLILFNCPFPADSFYKPRVDWEKNIYYQNKILEEAWTKGISNITEASWQTIAYVARYITKKINGKESEDYYAALGEKKEFFRVSNQPGIGKSYYDRNKEEIYKYDKILIKHGKETVTTKPPKYYDKLLEKENPELMEKIKEKRKDEMNKAIKEKMNKTSLTRWEQLQVEMRTKEDAASTLKRPL